MSEHKLYPSELSSFIRLVDSLENAHDLDGLRRILVTESNIDFRAAVERAINRVIRGGRYA